MLMRPARAEDRSAITLEPVIRARDTYALDRDMSEEAALSYRMGEVKEERRG
jgi:hypothetical protein